MTEHRHTALVIEDEPSIRDVIVDVLEGEGMAAVPAPDGPEGLRLLAQQDDCCVLLLDCMLPTMDGLDVLRQARQQRPGVPVIVMSASPGHLAEAMAAGATRGVQKPFDVEHLLALVARNCTHRAGPRPSSHRGRMGLSA